MFDADVVAMQEYPLAPGRPHLRRRLRQPPRSRPAPTRPAWRRGTGAGDADGWQLAQSGGRGLLRSWARWAAEAAHDPRAVPGVGTRMCKKW